MCEPPRASVVERGVVLWWVAGLLTYLCPLNIRPLPRGWSEHRRASVRSARGVPRVCIEGNSHSEAEVSKDTAGARTSGPPLTSGAHPDERAGAVLSPKRKPTQNLPKKQSQRSNKSKSIIDREGDTHEPTESPTPLRAFRRMSGKPVVGISPTRRRSPPGAQRPPLTQRLRTRRRLTFPSLLDVTVTPTEVDSGGGPHGLTRRREE